MSDRSDFPGSERGKNPEYEGSESTGSYGHDETKRHVSGQEEVSQAASEVTDEVKAEASRLIEEERGVIARQLRALSRAIDSAAGTLEADQQSGMAEYARWGATEVEQMADQVEHQDIRSLFTRMQQLGQEHPGLLLLGSSAAGFFGARLMIPPDSGAQEQPQHQQVPGQEPEDITEEEFRP